MDKERIIRIVSGVERANSNVMFDTINAWFKATGQTPLPNQMDRNELHRLMDFATQYWMGVHSVHILKDKNNKTIKIF